MKWYWWLLIIIISLNLLVIAAVAIFFIYDHIKMRRSITPQDGKRQAGWNKKES